ncbi:hypothetical protein L798_14300 [Zootermopsis nevadensis]|uniref:Uncharacterized protein n=1 Tax=Zootermopsis nevadensis TaxID=136037 RepID=A0A067QRW5_ZOONE|nr:hypothetical protein L798_14300 [Zootermopsis nevadensis]
MSHKNIYGKRVDKDEIHRNARYDEHQSNAYFPGTDIKWKCNQEQADDEEDDGKNNIYLYGRNKTSPR